MPRNASGDFSLVAGNPVAGGTPIEPSWANNTLSDIASAMTDSLSRKGEGGMLAPFQNADGAIGAPGITWVQEPGSGLYRAALADSRFSIAGKDTTRWIDDSGSPAGEQKPFQIWNGLAWAAPLALNDGNIQLADTKGIYWDFAGVPTEYLTVNNSLLTVGRTTSSATLNGSQTTVTAAGSFLNLTSSIEDVRISAPTSGKEVTVSGNLSVSKVFRYYNPEEVALLSSGQLTTSYTATKVSPHSAAGTAQDLNAIVVPSARDGEIVMLSLADPGDVITVVNSANVRLAGATDFVMDSVYDRISLFWDQALTSWCELYRSKNPG